MKRRHFLSQTSALGVVGSVSSSLVQAAESDDAPKVEALIRSPLVVMAPRRDGVELIWAVSRLSRGRVEWTGPNGESGQAHTDGFGFYPQSDTVLRSRLDGLKPDTEYKVRSVTEAIDGDAETAISEWRQFRTLAGLERDHASFVVWNDTHIHDETIRRLYELTPKADFHLWNGDTCNNWNDESLFVPVLLNPGGCDLTVKQPLFLTMGNHDVRGKYAFEMPRYFATPSGRAYWAMRHGPLAAIFMNTGEDKPDDHPSFEGRVSFSRFREEQAAWLKEVIETPEMKDAPFRVLFCHIPMRLNEEVIVEDYDLKGKNFDFYARSSRELWHESLVKWGAQVVISGHMHQEEWVEPNDQFPYAQIVGGGPKPEQARYIHGEIRDGKLTVRLHNLENQVTIEKSFLALG